MSYNPHLPVRDIVLALRKYNIPISGIDKVFTLVKININQNTIPYEPSPNLFLRKDVAKSEITEIATDPKG